MTFITCYLVVGLVWGLTYLRAEKFLNQAPSVLQWALDVAIWPLTFAFTIGAWRANLAKHAMKQREGQ